MGGESHENYGKYDMGDERIRRKNPEKLVGTTLKKRKSTKQKLVFGTPAKLAKMSLIFSMPICPS